MRDTLKAGRFFLPGPTEVHPDVLAAQAAPMIGHRGKAIEELLEGIEDGLKQVFRTEREVIISTSSATGLMEAALRNGVKGGRVLSLVNGAFSQRFSEISEACGFHTQVWEVPWGKTHEPEALAERLSSGDYDAVSMTQSETSTGALQDLRSIAEVTAGHPEVMLLVDSVTGVGGAEVETDAWALDFVLTGSQKALALPPGLAFGVASESMMARSGEATAKGFYFDLTTLSKYLGRMQTPATPAVSLLYALEIQLGRILSEGVEGRLKRHRDMQARTIDWVEEKAASGVDLKVLADEGRRSPTVTCIEVPGRAGGPDIVAAMKQRGFVIGSGYGKLKESTIRIGHMGDHTVDELDAVLAELDEVIR